MRDRNRSKLAARSKIQDIRAEKSARVVNVVSFYISSTWAPVQSGAVMDRV